MATPTDCFACLRLNAITRPATVIAGQYDEGDENIPAVWRPICSEHFNYWFEDVPAEERLPYFFLTA